MYYIVTKSISLKVRMGIPGLKNVVMDGFSEIKVSILTLISPWHSYSNLIFLKTLFV